MSGNKTHSVHFDPSVCVDQSSERSTAAPKLGGVSTIVPTPAALPVKRNGVVRKIMLQTIGEQFEDTTVATVQSFVASIENYCASTESLASLGKSLYTSSALVFVVDEAMRVILWNDCAIKLSGYLRDEVAGRNLIKELPHLILPASATVLIDALAQCVKGSAVTGIILELVTKDEMKLTLLGSCTPLVGNPIGAGMLVVAQDLTHLSLKTVNETTLATTPAVLNQASKNHPVLNSTQAVATAVVPLVTVAVSKAAAIPSSLPAAMTSNASTIPGWSEIAPNYSIECVLGQGSYGQVVRCKHLPTGEIVAIKKIQMSFQIQLMRSVFFVNFVYYDNCDIQHCADSRNYFTIGHEHFQDLFVVFEYLPSDLEKLLHSPQFLTAEHLRWLLLDLLKALKYMHSAEIVHRDLKPANVLLNLSPVAIKFVTLVWRVVSRRVGVHPRTPAGRIKRQLTEHVVTRWYRAPEIIFRDHDYSAAIDVWSVGCIFAELLSMQKSSVPSHYQREPLFPGVSCFPLSPGAGQVALPQDSRDQLNTILDVLGTMEEEDIAEIADPDEMYPGAEPEAIDLLTWMLKMNPNKRATLDEALSHKYLASIRSLEEELVAPGTILLEFDEKKMNVLEIRQRMISEIRFYHPTAGIAAVDAQLIGVTSKKSKQG
ncbi:putative PAS domain, protein kinase domain, protein kinase-like domain superfamily [Plasmopara halstedii]